MINHQGTARLIEAIQGSDASKLQTIVFTSTCAVYGDRSNLWVDETMHDRPPHHA